MERPRWPRILTASRRSTPKSRPMGVRVLAQWALLGPYDFCTVLDAPDEKTMARVALVLGLGARSRR